LFTNERIKPKAHAHVLEGFMGFAQCIGVPFDASTTDSLKWSIPISEKDRQWVAEQVTPLANFAVISPAASKAERNWLPERYAQTADYLKSKGLNVVLCGGPGALDAELRDRILEHTHAISVDLVGKTSLPQMLAVLGEAQLVIAPDTGPAHMATTQRTPVIGLYAYSNPRRTGPYLSYKFTASVYDECIAEQAGKPWHELPWGIRAKGEGLMEKITTEQVCRLIDRALTT
jgi:heptosyltransferase I